jgi:hypothetical protein
MLGVTLIEVPVTAPGFQVKLTAPFAVRVDEAPLQIEVGEAVAVTVGLELTVRETVRVLTHAPFAPVTV